jgi:sigma-B regulation protein RsbU (phosphoserine phosphatase)
MSTAQATAARPAAVTVVNPSGQKSRVPIDSIPFIIGRQSENQLVLRDNRISRVHARIVGEDASYVLVDEKSRHGVYVNGERVTRHTLQNGDTVTFGFPDSYQLIFTQEEADLNKLLDHLSAPSSSSSSSAVGGNLAKLRALVEVARALQSSLSTGEVLDAVVDAALTVTGSERGFLLLRRDEDLDIRVARDRRGMPLAKTELKVPTKLIGRALKQRRELLSMNFDPEGEGAARGDMSVANLELRSVVCVPLVRVRTGVTQETMHTSMNETVGLLYMDSRLGAADMSTGNRELLQTLALEASTILENARLLDEERAKQRMEEELKIARVIQQGMLPRDLPTTGWFRVAGSSLASHQVGGDYFDVIQIHPECWSVVVADVSGKGVSSALLAGLLQGAFLRSAETADQICDMLSSINKFLNERTQGEKYATLFYGSLDADGVLRWSNAGHCPPFLVHPDGQMEMLEATGIPVGLLDFSSYEVQTSRLGPGDKLVIYSDGLSEAADRSGDFFELDRMRSVIRASAAADCGQMHTAMMRAVEEFTGGAEQRDDITLVVAEYNP